MSFGCAAETHILLEGKETIILLSKAYLHPYYLQADGYSSESCRSDKEFNNIN